MYYLNLFVALILLFIGIWSKDSLTVMVGLYNLVCYYGERILDAKSI